MKAQSMGRALVGWYEVHRRTLPWREDLTPYRVLVSEIMLQQTGVKTVLGYFESFLRQFPDLVSLACASDEALLKAWEGMGYYKRAFRLREAARVILNDFRGVIPRTPNALLGLPGVGYYTANAVAALAYNHPCIALDGNAVRVLSRLFTFKKDVSKSDSRRDLAHLGIQIMPSVKASAFNQALMELGSLVCRPKRPLCAFCPVFKGCKSFKEKGVTGFPIKPKRGVTLRKSLVLGLVLHQGRVFLLKRPQAALLGGLWELPYQEILEPSDFETQLERFLWERFRLLASIEGCLGIVCHSVSRFRMKAKVFLGTLNPTVPPPILKEGLFVPLKDLHLHPMTALSHKALNLYKNPKHAPHGVPKEKAQGFADSARKG